MMSGIGPGMLPGQEVNGGVRSLFRDARAEVERDAAETACRCVASFGPVVGKDVAMGEMALRW